MSCDTIIIHLTFFCQCFQVKNYIFNIFFNNKKRTVVNFNDKLAIIYYLLTNKEICYIIIIKIIGGEQMNFRYRLMQLMSGRYGVDNLNYFIYALAVLLAVINIFLRFELIQLVVYLLMFYGIFRTLSRNLEARRRENYWFKNKLNFIMRQKELYNQRKNDKFHVYKKCPSCKAILRLPYRIGTHTTVCPRCSREFTVKVKK